MSREVKLRLRWFEYYLQHDGNVSLTCRHFGIARTTFLRWFKRFDPTDVSTLEDKSRRPKTFRQPEVSDRAEELVRMLRQKFPHLDRNVICEVLKSKHDINLSPATVGRIIKRNGLYFGDSPSHTHKRRMWLEKHGDDSSSLPTQFLPTAEL